MGNWEPAKDQPVDALEAILKSSGIATDIISYPYEAKARAIKRGLAPIGSSLSRTGKIIVKGAPYLGGAIVLADNVNDMRQSGKLQTSNLLDGTMYGISIGVGAFFPPVGAGIAIGYGALQLVDIYYGKVGTNYVNDRFDFRKLDQ